MIQLKDCMNNKIIKLIKKKIFLNIKNCLIKVLLKAIHQAYKFNRKIAIQKTKIQRNRKKLKNLNSNKIWKINQKIKAIFNLMKIYIR